MYSGPESQVDLFRCIAEATDDLVIFFSAKGTLDYISPSCRRYGYEPEDLIGSDPAWLVHPDDRERSMGNIVGVVRGEPPPPLATRRNRYRTKSGDWIWLEGNPQAIRGPDGQILGALNILRDITERREQEQLFENAFLHAAIGKALVGGDGRFVRLNEELCRLTGYSEAELLQLDFQTITHPDDLASSLENLRELLSRRIDKFRGDKRYVRADGSFVWVHLAVSAVRDPDGDVIYYLAQVQDLTDRRNAEAALRESEARYKLIAENTSDAIIMTDLTGRPIYVSEAIRAAGYEPSDLLGDAGRERVHPEDAPAVQHAFQSLLKGRPGERVRWRGRRSDGHWGWMESNPSLLRDPETGRATGFLDVLRDVDEQVRQEAALAEARRAAEAATEAKAQFLANMSHEIRTPLTAVLGFSELLQAKPDLDAEARRDVDRIAAAGRALMSLVNDVLDLSKLDSGGFEICPEPTDVAALLVETFELFHPQAAAKGLKLRFDPAQPLPARLSLDGARLRQVLLNLIGNAVKFTDAGEVSLAGAYGDDGRLRVAVTDTGPGMDAEQQALLFQRFVQVDGSSTRRHGGTGLGLAISRGMVRAMGGDIEVTSAPGEGSTFTVVLPAKAVEARKRAAATPEPVSLDGLAILVVDDNPQNRELACAVLRHLGVEAQAVDGGEAALCALADTAFDAVLLDQHMPGMSGRDTLRGLRAAEGPNATVPVLVFSADADPDAALVAEFDGVVTKPLVLADMCQEIARAVSQSPRRRAAA